jgi:DNA helicase-2/ATP-dependent DNA helicase PcrA
MDMFKRHLEQISKETAGQILFYFFEDSGLLGYYLDPQTVKTEKEAENVAKFFEKLQSFAANREDASVFAVVDWIDLAMELGESPMSAEIDWTRNNAVNILTVHESKGLEFPFVFVVNLVTQRFPSRDRKEQLPIPPEIIREALPTGDENLQEERRLFYVAITRAKEKLFLTASRYYGEAKRERKLSPFIAETLGDAYVAAMTKKNVVKDPGQQLSLLDMFNPTFTKNVPTQQEIVEAPPRYTPTYISYSQLNTFLACPLHYKLRYIMNIPTPATPALSYGVSVHGTLRDFATAIKSGESIHSEDIGVMLKQNWLPTGYSGKLHEQQSYKQAEHMLLDFAKTYIAEKANTIAIEMPFNFWLGKVKVGGRIDRIDKLKDGRIEIIDYKTGNNLPNEKKIKDDFQLLFYALAATEIKDPLLQKKSSDVVLTLFYLEANKKFSVTHTEDALVLAKEKILKLIEEISHSDFRCSGGMMCKNCEYKMICQTHSS